MVDVPANQRHEFGFCKRTQQTVCCAQFEAFGQFSVAASRADNQQRCESIVGVFSNEINQFKAIDVWQLDVGDDQRKMVPGQKLQCAESTFGDDDFDAAEFSEHLCQPLAFGLCRFDDENFWRMHRRQALA